MTSAPSAVVTGAGSGIGRYIARTLLVHGWRVALAGRRLDALQETAVGASSVDYDSARPGAVVPGLAAPAAPGPALAAATDVSDPESVRALFERVRDEFGRLDLLVNNAGTFGPYGPVDEIDISEWSQTIATNLTGAFLCARHAVRIMRAQLPRGGRIINNGSVSAHSPRPGSAAYTASKHAITGLTKSIALDGRAHDIACGQIDIGNAATEMTASVAQGVPQADGRIMPEATFDPQHVASAVLYMAQLPLEANVQFLTITATKMPFIGRG
ncbi:MAG TPA: SDR family oxidoreductase [Streptosporangiaceae bacterium]|nr:SDR family oxidoreductase [Streptosporangiaceae bacterium]